MEIRGLIIVKQDNQQEGRLVTLGVDFGSIARPPTTKGGGGSLNHVVNFNSHPRFKGTSSYLF